METDFVFEIRLFNSLKHFCELNKWWVATGLPAPELKRVPENTFLVYVNDVPVVSAGMILTDVEVVWIDNFIGNPAVTGDLRRSATRYLLEHMEKLARASRFDLFFCMATNVKLKYYYEQLGFNLTCENVFTFTKEL